MLERLREKYEVILGFVTLVISLSAFKDELAAVQIDLGWIQFSLATYLLYCVYGFSLCLYLYVSESFLKETPLGKWKGLGYVLWIAVFLFGFILVTPVLVLISWLILNIYQALSEDGALAGHAVSLVGSIISAILGFLTSLLTSRTWLRERKRRTVEMAERREIIELEHARKLLDTGFFSHSILESFKALESHLFRKITEADYQVSPHRFDQILAIASKIGVVQERDIPGIKDIRGMRNVSAHVVDAGLTKEHAEFALNLVRDILRRTSTQS
ncbi:MAG: hypothetical protein H6592_13555 [Flavobacteriales bacterium]|nr:hypothetical protein [Flavobacteriales bacterium]